MALQIAVDEKLTSLHGVGPWSGGTTEKMVLFKMRQANVYVARQRGKIIAMLTLGTKKPWAIDKKYFSECQRHGQGVFREARLRRNTTQFGAA